MLRKILKLWIAGGLITTALPFFAELAAKEWEQVSSLVRESIRTEDIFAGREILLDGTVTESADTVKVTKSGLTGDVTYVIPLNRTTRQHNSTTAH